MKKTIFILIAFLTTFCTNRVNRSNFFSLLREKYDGQNAYQLNSRFHLNYDRVKLTLIDTPFYKPLNLIDTSRKDEKDAQMKVLKDYDCRLLGIIKFPKFYCVLTDSYTISADNGYPVTIIATYDDLGNYISRVVYKQHFQNDYTPEPDQFITINQKDIKLELIEKNFEIIDSAGVEVRKYVNTTCIYENYQLGNNGQIMKK
jgi:hypothetical protein